MIYLVLLNKSPCYIIMRIKLYNNDSALIMFNLQNKYGQTTFKLNSLESI